MLKVIVKTLMTIVVRRQEKEREDQAGQELDLRTLLPARGHQQGGSRVGSFWARRPWHNVEEKLWACLIPRRRHRAMGVRIDG